MKNLLPLAALAMLLACSQSPQPDPAENDAVVPGSSQARVEDPASPIADEPSPAATLDVPVPPVALPVTSLRGDWRLVAVDGEQLAPVGGVVLDIGRDRIEFDNCQQVTWGYTLSDGRLTTRRVPAITIDINPKPLPCAASFPPPVARMVEALDGAERVDPAGNGGVTIKGSAGRLSLEPMR